MNFNKNKLLLSIIEEEYKKIIKEQEEPAAVSPTEEVPEDITETEAEEPTELETGEAEVGDADISTDDATEPTIDMPAPGGGFGGGGRFSTGGFEPDLSSDEKNTEQSKKSPGVVNTGDIKIPSDPVATITNDAVDMLKITQQPSIILQNIKHSIQRYFSDPSDASLLVKTLYDTENLVLKDVARRLLMYIEGT